MECRLLQSGAMAVQVDALQGTFEVGIDEMENQHFLAMRPKNALSRDAVAGSHEMELRRCRHRLLFD